MLRGNHSIMLLGLSATIAAVVVNVQQSVYADTKSTTATITITPMPVQDEKVKLEQYHRQELLRHPSLLVDTKYWIRNTEFGVRDNWRDQIKPCTILERIEFIEQAAISMGNSLDSLGGALESNLKELTLSMTGVLLLEEDTLNDQQADPSFFLYLNQSGDCFDSESNYHNTQIGDKIKQKEENMFNEPVFKFEPESDQMSWFNPENWRSELNEEEINDWIPDSHRIPCSEDIVVFGSRHIASEQILEANERGKTVSFKVNFRPSQAILGVSSTSSSSNQVSISSSDEIIDRNHDGNARVNGLQVSRLLIGDTEYNQREFQQLISSKQFDNILFQFNDSRSVLKAGDGFAYSTSSLLTLDESSVQSFFGDSICSDEAGCLCGNENVNILKTICSFTYNLEPSDQPCYDPIISSGYCSRICATVLTISMDPIKFKEKLLITTLGKIYSDSGRPDFVENVFSAPRRTSSNKYEITFRHVPSDTDDYEANLGRESEFAQLVYQKLNNDAWKTFFGIKTISLKSSTQWRNSSYNIVFWPSLACCMCISLILWTLQEFHNVRIDSNANESRKQNLVKTMNSIVHRVLRYRHRDSDEFESILQPTTATPLDHLDRELDYKTQIPLVSLNANYISTSDNND